MKESPITPTVGRVVLVRGSATNCGEPDRDFPGLVTRVWSQNTINVHVYTEQPGGIVLTSVMFDDADVSVPQWAAWRWMPYQVAQAAKHADPVNPAPTDDLMSEGRRERALEFAVSLRRSQDDWTDTLKIAKQFKAWLAGKEAAQ